MKFLKFILPLQFLSFYCFAQNTSNDDIQQVDISIPANISDWYSTNIIVKKNDLVFLNVYGLISLGLFAGEVNGAGNKDNPFLVDYSRYKDIPHGALICSNDDEVVFAQYKPDLQNDNPLYKCVSHLSSSTDDNIIGNLFTEEYIGNFFQPKSDEELKLLINDGDYSNNLGFFKVSIIIYHNFFPEIGDVVVYWGGPDGIRHSGYITEIDPTDKCTITKISSFLIKTCNGLYGHPFDANPNDVNITCNFGIHWTVYHTNRANGRLIDTHSILGTPCILPGTCNGYTDNGTLIYLSYKSIAQNENCHAYTFLPYSAFSSYHYITGYQCNGGVLHDDTKIDDQGMAVEYILSENGYTQGFAFDTEGQLHHDAAYDVNAFKLRK